MGIVGIWSRFSKWYAERRDVDQRAHELLCANLNSAQLATFNACGRFEVIGGDTGRHYVIRNASMMNVDEMNADGECVKAWCFAPVGNLAQGDVLLAQKVALESFENEALLLAKAHYFSSAQLSSAHDS